MAEPATDLDLDGSEPPDGENPGSLANVVYILFLVSIVVGLTSLVGLVIAYVKKGSAPDWVATHYRFQIRTFWIGTLYFLISTVGFAAAAMGGVLILVTLVWFIARCARGMTWLSRGEPVPNPASWAFG